MGRKCKLGNYDDAMAKIDAYFAERCNKRSRTWSHPPTHSGLALALGYPGAMSLWELANKPPQSLDKRITIAVKMALARIDEYHEERLAREPRTPIGSIFVLKNRHWQDAQNQHITADISQVVRTELPSKRRAGDPVGESSTVDKACGKSNSAKPKKAR